VTLPEPCYVVGVIVGPSRPSLKLELHAGGLPVSQNSVGEDRERAPSLLRRAIAASNEDSYPRLCKIVAEESVGQLV